MNTPAHLLLGAAVYARPSSPKVNIAALFGALLPDLSLYLLVAWNVYVLGVDPNVVFGSYYFSESWQQIFAVDNSFILWGGAFGLALWSKRSWIIAFSGSGLMHVVTDFLLHNDDARRHLWPLSDWVFHSPVSYWDHNHYGNVFGPIEVLLCVTLIVVLWRRFHTHWVRGLLLVAGAMQVMPFVVFFLILSKGA
ncbi:MAG: cobalamin biosynthesis protein CobQ [Pseudoruegeria sp.]